MLRSDLIDIVNSGSAWAFVGSGVSIDAGYPGWRDLVNAVLTATEAAVREKITSDRKFVRSLDTDQFPACLSVIEKYTSRDHIENAVRLLMSKQPTSPKLAETLCEWPFAGYLTTNYDTLLESILAAKHPGGWIAVGNKGDEIKKVASDARNLVWHIHGSVDLPEQSDLILTEEDYDSIYLESSPLERQLRGFLAQKRIVFVGFGFADPELKRLLKIVGLYSNPARPAIAFLADAPQAGQASGWYDLRTKNNIDVVTYPKTDGSHAALGQLIGGYNSLVLTRSLSFNQPERPCPSYDPETSGLLIYNQIAMAPGRSLGEDALTALIESRILALLKYQGPQTIDQLRSDIEAKAAVLAGVAAGVDSSGFDIQPVLSALEAEGLLVGQGENLLSLTVEGDELASKQTARANRMEQQFAASLRERAALVAIRDDPESHLRVATAAETFLKDAATRRALGVAMAWVTPAEHQQYHIVALLQSLPDYFSQLRDTGEAIGLIDLIRSVLARPTETEATYLGALMQAHFGLHLIGVHPDTFKARAAELSRTAFLLDATTLIPLLARSSRGYPAARHLLKRLSSLGATAATTDLLVTEVAEHARWAAKQLEQSPVSGVRGLVAAAKVSDNLFIEGCIAEASEGRSVDFNEYLDAVCSAATGHLAKDEAFQSALEREEVACKSFDQWDGFDESLWAERDTLQSRIQERRIQAGTFHHERQVRAEAEAVLIVQRLREGKFTLDGTPITDAYFLSHSRIVDDVSRPARPITMRPQAAQQWFSTLSACDPDELQYIVNGILWELAERGMSLVDNTRILAVFGPLINASQIRLTEEVAHHRSLIANRYGEEGTKAFTEVTGAEVAFASESYFSQKAEALEAELQNERERSAIARKGAQLTEKDRQELEKYRAAGKFKRAEAKKRKRRKESQKGARGRERR